MVTQRRSDRRELENWERERERERERWAREDALRTFAQRQAAYVEFYESLRDMVGTAYDHGMGISDPEPDSDELPFERNQATFRKLHSLRVYASPEVELAASAAYTACWQWGCKIRHGQDDDGFYRRHETYAEAELELYNAIRHDLGIESTHLPLPAGGDEQELAGPRYRWRRPRLRRH
jgi:hypothetical protein